MANIAVLEEAEVDEGGGVLEKEFLGLCLLSFNSERTDTFLLFEPPRLFGDAGAPSTTSEQEGEVLFSVDMLDFLVSVICFCAVADDAADWDMFKSEVERLEKGS